MAASAGCQFAGQREYIGVWPWGETKNARDPETGKIRQEPRPDEESERWTRRLPLLRIIDDANGKYLFCPKYHQGICSCRTTLRRDRAQRMILNEIGKRILDNPIWFRAAYDQTLNSWRQQQQRVPTELASAERASADVERKIMHLVDRIENGLDDPDVKRRLEQRRAERRELVKKVDHLKRANECRGPEPTEAWVRERIEQLGESLSGDAPAAAYALRELVGGEIVVTEIRRDARQRFQAVTSVRNRARSYWASISLPYPESGIRLLRRDTLETFQDQMAEFREELDEAVERLDEQYAALMSAARERLGSLYNESDYPASLAGLFDVSWDFPSVEPPSYLQQLNPELYEQECRRVQARFEEAVQMAEEAFIEELSQLVSHLTERLGGQEDGRPKIFRDTAVGRENCEAVLPSGAAICYRAFAFRSSIVFEFGVVV